MRVRESTKEAVAKSATNTISGEGGGGGWSKEDGTGKGCVTKVKIRPLDQLD